MKKYDLICIGAGPTGLACAIEATRVGLTALVIDKGAICNSLYHYPVSMFFSPRRNCWKSATCRWCAPQKNQRAWKR